MVRRLLTLAERLYSDEPRSIANSLNFLGLALHGQARDYEAEKVHRRALVRAAE